MLLHAWGILVACLQVHGWFPLTEVMHRLPALPAPKLRYADGFNRTQYGQVACVPKHVVLAMTDEGTHGFLHDDARIRRCMWDGDLSLEDKVGIASKMLAWLRPMKSIEHHVHNYEDGIVLLMAKFLVALEDEE